MSKVGVLDKAVAVLHAFQDGQVVLEPRDIAVVVGLPVPTVYRLCQALGDHGLLERRGAGYRLGLELVHLGARAAEGIELRRVVRPHLEWLRDRTGENAELHLRYAATRVSVEVVASRQNLRPMAEIGAPLPIHVGASGKVLLASLPGMIRHQLAQASQTQFGGGPLNSKALTDELDRAHSRGWADSDGERAAGVAALAAPIMDRAEEVVGAVVLSGPSTRLTAERRREVAPLVVEAATRTSADLGRLTSGPEAGRHPSGRRDSA